ncbi:MAG: hypothetical protein GX895_05755 [Clostridiales bacterium]|uniref:hypothetical protein n=1 Tax=Clostridium sp. N3C TaxID=1776758 RepID=UPI00092E1C20|nr:hypothetical protein [Clostridium sp. N3C]NLZ48287.1 hypothetical protein [Clostridiales bacterium]SCN22938.1 hypothetical protein N3C_1031 [Clostridium sp. N3C]
MSGKVIYVDFKKQAKKYSSKKSNPGLLKSCYYRLKNFFTFTSGSKPVNEVSPFKEMM